MAKVLFVFILALNIQSSFSTFLIQQNEFVKRSGGLAVHNSGNVGQVGNVPFAAIHQHQGYQNPIENRVIRLSKPVNRPPELPADFPVGQPKLPKVQYEEDKKQYGLIGGRKMIAGKKENSSSNTNQQQEVEELSTGMKIVSPFAIYGGFHIGKEFGLMAKKVCNFACQKAKELKERNRLRNLENSRSTLIQSSPSASTSSSSTSLKSRSRGIRTV